MSTEIISNPDNTLGVSAVTGFPEYVKTQSCVIDVRLLKKAIQLAEALEWHGGYKSEINLTIGEGRGVIIQDAKDPHGSITIAQKKSARD